MRDETKEEREQINRIERVVMDGAIIRLYEPCNCGAQVKHNNGGNYHTVIHVKNPGRYINQHGASSGKWMMRVGTTCELVDFPEWQESDYIDCILAIRDAIQEGWEITINEFERKDT